MAKVWFAGIAIFASIVTAPILDAQERQALTPCVPGTPCGPIARVDTDDKVKQLEQVASTKTDPESWYVMAQYCLEQSAAAGASKLDARRYAIRGIQAIDRALWLNSVYLDALRMKSALLGQQAKNENDQDVRDRVIAEAKLYQDSADRIAKRRDAALKRYARP